MRVENHVARVQVEIIIIVTIDRSSTSLGSNKK